MHIQTLNINLAPTGHLGLPSPMQMALVAAFMHAASAANDEPEAEPEAAAPSVWTPPPIGTYVLGQGGIYAGMVRGENGEPIKAAA